ncbi:unnamed protein product [Hanseniaspora opuntiae]
MDPRKDQLSGSTTNTSELRSYYNPLTFNADYDVRYIPKEGIIDKQGLPLVSKLKSLSNLAKQQQNKRLSPSINELNWWIKFRNEHSDSQFDENMKNLTTGASLNIMNGDYYEGIRRPHFSDFFDLKKLSRLINAFAIKFMKVYIKHLLIQPFVISKTFLQVHDFENTDDNTDGVEIHIDPETNNNIIITPPEADQPLYFKERTSIDEVTHADEDSAELATSEEPDTGSTVFVEGGTSYHKVYKIHPTSSNTTNVIKSIYKVEGIFGVVRSNNTTFIYNFVNGTLEAWINGFIAPFLNIPNPNYVDVALSNDIVSSILLALSSTILTGLILLPLELVNMKFIITKMRHIHFHRSMKDHIKNLSFKDFFRNLVMNPKNLKLLFFQAVNRMNTAIYHKSLLQTVLLRNTFEIDKFNDYKRYETGNFIIKFIQLLAKVPLDNLYKREQVDYLMDTHRSSEHCPLPIRNKNDLVIVPYKEIPLMNYFTSYENFKGLWKGYKMELIGVGCSYLERLLDTDRELTIEEKF